MGQRLIITEEEKNTIKSLYESMGVAFGNEMNGLKVKKETNESSKYLGQRQGDKDRFYDENDREYVGDFDFDYDEEEFDDYDTFISKVGDQKWFAPEGGRMFFDKYRDQFGPFKFRRRRM